VAPRCAALPLTLPQARLERRVLEDSSVEFHNDQELRSAMMASLQSSEHDEQHAMQLSLQVPARRLAGTTR
jgi:hypothetical protein